jgi:hypothetical protein
MSARLLHECWAGVVPSHLWYDEAIGIDPMDETMQWMHVGKEQHYVLQELTDSQRRRSVFGKCNP